MIIYSSGSSLDQIRHARLRMQCSSLKQHLFNKNLVDSNLCTCESAESIKHFFFDCPFYATQRQIMLSSLRHFKVNCDTLLFGDSTLSDLQNKEILYKVQKIILDSKRFSR